jgi:Arc/MetJ-type ribon-helix-helix transcriptional regulator
MDSELLEAEVKTRIPLAHKKELQALARGRYLKLSDIVREAIREKLQKAGKKGDKGKS